MNSISLLSLLEAPLIYYPAELNPLSRIVRGEKAVNYQFPWHVSLRITLLSSAFKTNCGGSLIAANYILTAASCLQNATTIQADIGSIEFTQPFESQNTTQYRIHPEYNDELKLNNITVIGLHASVTFRTDIRAIVLPRVSESKQLFESMESYVSDFEIPTADGVYLSNELRYAHQTVISNENCRQSFDSCLIGDSVMCVVGFNGISQSLCYFDQDGALVSHIDGFWVQIGVFSILHTSG